MSPRTKEQNEVIRTQSRKAILNAAFELFALDGFSKTSMAAIAKEAGISKGLIYHHFESKEDVLKAVFDNLIAETADVWLQEDENSSPVDTLNTIIDFSLIFMKQSPGWVRLLIHLALQEDVMEGLSEHIHQLREGKILQVKPLFEALGYENAAEEAMYFGAKMDGISMGFLALGDEYPLQQMINRLKLEYNIHIDETE
ncbi:TetR/AcrR family transcriptional regulator [Phaeocystidibacter luteus]|uniref:TetR/AcrR family transcriptional regulator n=1 Tax=Phaeocystidibacter luteus TaxID=911197 RepID=A0A6N6RIP3_9FLAO|nr:TetR/AcrR family transcriptional regulator [Phaeocystidibacter luteus]KAB2813846.1 TetR/AcrR family transcriptional regulator [Phaeocystidibacter luteus]